MRIGRILSLTLLTVLCLWPVSARAQYTDDSTLTGLPPFGSFHGSDFDSVLLQNGNLHVQIPILSLPMRNGKNFTWRYIYDTPAWQGEWFPNPLPMDPNNGIYRILPLASIQLEDAGFRLTNPARWSSTFNVNQVSCPQGPPPNPTYRAGYTVTDPDGTSHPFPLQVSNSGPGGPFCGGQLVKAPALDGSGIFWDLPNNIIYLKDGTQFPLGTLADSNGNPISPIGTNGVTATNGPTVSLTTPLGVTLGHAQYTTWTFKDSNGTPQTYQLTWGAFDVLTNMCHLVPHGIYPCSEYTLADVRPIRLTLPTGKSYQFSWQNNAALELLGITLPTGASITYTYADFNRPQPPPPGTTRHVNVSWNIRRQVATRTVQVGSQTSQWTYSIGVGGGGVTNPDGTSESHALSAFTIGSLSSSGRVETLITYTDASGSVVRTVQKDWTGEVGPYYVANLRVIRETTTLDNGQASKVETDYDNTLSYTVPSAPPTAPILPNGTYVATRMNPREKREFDFSGTLIRTTHYTYLHESNSTYANLNIVDRPTSVLTYAGPSTGSPVAKTFYEYDVYTHPNQPMVASGAVQHSSTFNTAYTTR
jgi:hypothetical protein